MRLRFLGAATVAALGVILMPGAALPVAQISDDQAEVADYDSRTGTIAPTKLQRANAKHLKAKVTWSRFGTPASISRPGKFLARGIRAKNAPAAARWYLKRHKALFGLQSLDGLVLDSSGRLVGSSGYAVSFRQVFQGIPTSESGLVTLAVVGSKARGWKVAYVSSSLTRATKLAGGIQLSAADAWARSAKVSRLTRSVANILSRKTVGGWTHLGVAGLDQPQLVRRVAFPTIRQGVVPAYESYVLDMKKALGTRLFVDARNGRILARSSIVDNAVGGKFKPQAVTVTPFSGALPATDAGCGPDHLLTVPAGIRALSGFADATNQNTDIVLELWKVGTPNVRLIQADTLLTPEQFRYDPAGGVPTGDYFIRVCDFPGGGAPPPPLTYTGTYTLDDTPAPPPYWARWKVFPANPALGTLQADPWNRPFLDNRETWCWRPAAGCDRVVGNLAARAPWDHDLVSDTPTLTTRGNNAWSSEAWTNPNGPGPFGFMPTSGLDRTYSYAWTDSWKATDCNTGDPSGSAFVPGTSFDIANAVNNLFVAHNRMHDWAYFLGFTEQNWNAQQRNFGNTEAFQQNDPVRGQAQAGAALPTPVAFAAGSRNNANMGTLPDGNSSVTNMYVWQPQAGGFYPPCADGDYDMAVIGHEYGHMIENRMIGKGNRRMGHHAGAMGESHGDLMAMEYLNENGLVPTGGENRYSVGAYATGNQQRAIRNYGMNFPMSGDVPRPGKQLLINALNFSDMGYDVTGPQVHADGEIWSATNFRIRQALIEKYNKQYPAGDAELQSDCANTGMPATRCPGNRRWIQLVFDSYLLMPTAPSMLQARDAQLAADLMRFGGANQKEIWLAFARSGFGVNATSTNTTADTDTDPTPDFEPVGTTPATVTFRVRNFDGDVVSNARIYVGHYEARVSPIADTNPATTGSINLDDVAKFAPGTYEFIVQAPGYGEQRFRESLRSGKSKTIRITLPTNWASATSGATATTTTGAATVGALIDDTESTNWNAPATNVGGAISVDGKTAQIDLAGTDDVRIRYIQVSAMIGAGSSRFSALRSFEIWACSSACTTDAGYSKVYASPDDAFPGNPPRPVAPHLILRRFDVPDFKATHLRFVVKTSQCTGGPAFQGDQDADPINNSDCDSGVAAASTRNLVRSAELQVFRTKPDIHD
jgi:extracellular elastinolytic metalloproteinase